MTNDQLTFADPCVVFALGREAAPFLREFRPQQRFRGSPCRARFCGPAWLTVLVLETGVGGALRSGLRVGDVVLATEVADADGNVWPATWPDPLPPGEWRPPLHRG